jgi:hypothetical protein
MPLWKLYALSGHLEPPLRRLWSIFWSLWLLDINLEFQVQVEILDIWDNWLDIFWRFENILISVKISHVFRPGCAQALVVCSGWGSIAGQYVVLDVYFIIIKFVSFTIVVNIKSIFLLCLNRLVLSTLWDLYVGLRSSGSDCCRLSFSVAWVVERFASPWVYVVILWSFYSIQKLVLHL